MEYEDRRAVEYGDRRAVEYEDRRAVEYEDRLRIVTPEGVDMELTLAGLGSRLVATTVDGLIQSALIVALFLALLALAGSFEFVDAPGDAETAFFLGLAVFAAVTFLVLFAYHLLFEAFASGRTPGKHVAGLRVVQVGGHPVGFRASAVRNLLRLIDLLPPVTYAVGMVSILASARNQRLGDIAAGTIVVRQRRAVSAPPTAVPVQLPAELASWDVSAVTAEELAAVRSFLDRRPSLTPEARASLAAELAGRLAGKVAGAAGEAPPEAFLERLAAAKSART